MNDRDFGLFLAGIFLFGFFAFIIPNVANTVWASTSTSYAKPLLIGVISTVIIVFIYAFYKVLVEGAI